jgi:1,4-dihydroxy-2-naphthoate octaprenyltransferase
LKQSKFRIWLSAARPQTLAASIVPIMVGASLAWSHYAFRLDTTIVALLCALLIQVGTNFANDYYDFVKGADTDDRIGFERATALGLISPQAMLTATYLTMGLAFLVGLYLVWVGGWIIFLIGILSMLFGVLYTGGPYPLGYNGLGDIFVFIFFGIIAVSGTYYVNALEWSTTSLVASLPVGALCVNILVVNNLRDIHQDKISGKRTLGVLFGEKMLKMEYLGLIFTAFLIPFIFYHFYGYGIAIMLPYLALPLAWMLIKQVYYHDDKKELNKTLERTAQFMILFGVLLSLGIIL